MFANLLKHRSMSMKQNISLGYFIKKTKLLKNGEAPIYLHITVNRKRVSLGINRSIDPDKWDGQLNGAKGRTKDIKQLNKYLDSLKHQIMDVFHELVSNNEEISAQKIKMAFLGEKEEEITLLYAHQLYNAKVMERVGIDYEMTTYYKYRASLSHLTKFIKQKYQNLDPLLEKLDYDFVLNYDHFLKTNLKVSQNTSVRYHKHLKKVLAHARATKLMQHDPYASFQLKLEKKDRGFLTNTELQSIASHVFKIKRLEQVRDCFLVQCFTGLSHSDLKLLSRLNIEIDDDGNKWIRINRKKTNVRSSIPVLSVVNEMIEKYKNHPQCQDSGMLFPVLTNQRMNGYLKEIAALCGLEKDLTTHIARHTFATTVTLNNNVPIETVSKMLGHNSISTTKIYARILDKKVGNDMKRVNQLYAS
jgi:site-specific recombinase XerD